jgi:cytochrome c
MRFTGLVSAAALALGWAIAGAPAQSQSLSGQEIFERRCTGCHALDRDKEGPRLRGVYGRAAAAVESFEYSGALRQAHVKWDDATLDKWLSDPDSVAAGADMAFRMKSAEERAAVIAYLRDISR